MELEPKSICLFNILNSYNSYGINYTNQSVSNFEYIECTTNIEISLNMKQDMFKISGFLIPREYNLADIDFISIHYNGNTIWNFPFYIITDFSNIVTDELYHIIKLHTNIFTKKNTKIPIFDLDIKMNISSLFDFQFKLILDNVHLPNNEFRKNILDGKYKFDILQYRKCNIKNYKYVNLISDGYMYTGYSGGFYLRTNCIPNGYTIQFDASAMGYPSVVFTHLDKYMISFKSQIIKKWNMSDELYKIFRNILPTEIIKNILKYNCHELILLWIPFFSDTEYTDYSDQTITHNGMRINIEFDNPFYGKLYYPVHNYILFDKQTFTPRMLC